ncbi:hypothetical protein Taro_020783 [Colocasia esculenta]|uniref:MHD domain-containing protein n=1 Tax=Colocasia esculenta TaxID=4460 RepID=A0A843UPK6_COLES|nr:hypothetical protein [Colocasia esculenta]
MSTVIGASADLVLFTTNLPGFLSFSSPHRRRAGPRVNTMLQCIFVISDSGNILELDEFLCRVADIISDYLGGLNEDLIKDNFVIVYELLDEMMDNGFPLTTEPNILREMISPPNIVSKMLSVVTGKSSNVTSTLPDATQSCVPWRKTDVKHATNEVYVDLVEEMDSIVNSDGNLVKCEIYGEILVNSNLSGFPDLTLSFMNPAILNDTCFWSIGRIPKDKAPSLTGNLTLEAGMDSLHICPVFQAKFKIMGVALSGLKIDKLDAMNMPNPPYKGFRALTRSGEYEVRS